MQKIKKNIFISSGYVFKKIIKDNLKYREYLKKEYLNLLYLKNNGIFLIPKVEEFNFKKGFLKTKYIAGINLKDIRESIFFFYFGKKLKLFHNKGLVHSELEVQDVICLKNFKFALVDFHHLNEKKFQQDCARFLISLNILKIKNPQKFLFINKSIREFILGYGECEDLQSYINLELNLIINSYKKGNFISRLKGLILDIIFLKLKLMKNE